MDLFLILVIILNLTLRILLWNAKWWKFLLVMMIADTILLFAYPIAEILFF